MTATMLAARRPPAADERREPAVKPRILVVDDEPSIRVSLDRYLVRRGHRVETAAEGEEALRAIERSATDPFDIIVSDLRMPGLSGEQLFRMLTERDASWERRIIFITGDAANPHALRIFAGSDVPVILKPFDLADLSSLVEELGEKSYAPGPA